MPLIETINTTLQSNFEELWSRALHNQAEGKQKFTVDSTDLLTIMSALIEMQEQIRVLKNRQ